MRVDRHDILGAVMPPLSSLLKVFGIVCEDFYALESGPGLPFDSIRELI